MGFQKLTVEQAQANASMFMYIFAPDEFLNALPQNFAKIIRGKALNQKKILQRSAKEYLGDASKWETEYVEAVRKGFIEQYDMTPIDALVVLAQGGTVAGKNWKEGVFGVGKLTDTYKNGTTVDAATGRVKVGGVYVGVDNIIYSQVNGEAIPYQIVSSYNGITYVTQYNKKDGKYYANSYSDAEGQAYKPNGTKIMSGADFATIWESIALWVDKFVDWLISIFSSNKIDDGNPITDKNTLPDQKGDGFVTEQAGFSTAALVVLGLVAAGTLAKGGLGK